jgi:hypothetical protein
MLLLSSGLLLAIRDKVDVPPAPGRVPEPHRVEPRKPAPSQWDAPAPQLYGEIRAALQTPIFQQHLAHLGRRRPSWVLPGRHCVRK